MTDYKNLKLVVTSSPHIRSNENTKSIMLDVIIAMVPALGWAVWTSGMRALTVTAFSVIGCIFFEWLYRTLMKRPQSIGDLSAVVTGMLIAFVCPVTAPYWLILVGDFIGIVLVKQLYGGIGKNFLNPALAARAFLFGWAGIMTTFAAPGIKAAIMGANADIVTAATPMSYLHVGDLAGVQAQYSVTDMFLGNIGGSLGEVSALCLLIGGAWLIIRKVITWHIPVAFIGTVAVLAFVFPMGNDPLQWMLYNVLGGGLMLGAIFMATDYATSPITHKGQIIYGIGCGLFTIFIRYFGAYNEGVCYSILVMNIFACLIDKYVKPARFGVTKSAKKEAAAK
ncbi:MAG: RnfABCDGE type electron transport complex subunit D [Oscillospiraceae bacterium]